MKGKALLGILAILIIIVTLSASITPENNSIDNKIYNKSNDISFEQEKTSNTDIGLPYEQGMHTEMFCEDLCGNGICDDNVYLDVDSTCYENKEECPLDCD